MKLEYIFIKPMDDYCASELMFQNFLCENRRIVFKSINEDNLNKKIINFDEYELEYKLEYIKVELSKEIIFHLIVQVLGENEENAVILGKFDSVVKEINEKYGNQFSINTIWNDVSLYYGSILYPRILTVENMLRKIIYLFMLKTVGSEWLNIRTPERFQTDIGNIIEKNKIKKSEINSEWLMYADFITLGYFFTAPYALKSDINDLFKELKNYEKNNNETKNNKILTSEIIKTLSEEYEPKNNWDRYFSDKLSVKSLKKFSTEWSSLYNIRNKVAHGKYISKIDFDKANVLIDNFKITFDECINIIDTLKITTEQAVAVESVAQQVISKENSKIADISNELWQYECAVNNGAQFDSNTLIGTITGSEFLANDVSLYSITDSARNAINAINNYAVENPAFARTIKDAGQMLNKWDVNKGIAASVEAVNHLKNVEPISAILDRPLFLDTLKQSDIVSKYEDIIKTQSKADVNRKISNVDVIGNEVELKQK